MQKMQKEYLLIYKLLKKIPKGKVTTYGEIARVLGNLRYCRFVGNVLNKNSDSEVPCHRVVRSDAKVGGFRYGKKKKIELLRKEGIKIKNGRILDFEKFFYRFAT